MKSDLLDNAATDTTENWIHREEGEQSKVNAIRSIGFDTGRLTRADLREPREEDGHEDTKGARSFAVCRWRSCGDRQVERITGELGAMRRNGELGTVKRHWSENAAARAERDPKEGTEGAAWVPINPYHFDI